MALLLALLSAPQAATYWLSSQTRDVETSAAVSSVMAFVGVGMAALLAYFYWRIASGNATAWLVTALTFVSVQGLCWSTMVVADETPIRDYGWLLLIDVLASCLLLALIWAVDHVTLTRDPLILGLGIGSAFALLRVLLVDWLGTLVLNDVLFSIALVLFLVLQVGIAATLLRLERVPTWVCSRMAAAAVLIAASQALHYSERIDDAWGVVAIVTGTFGAALFIWTTAHLLRIEIRRQLDVLAGLEQRIADAESGLRLERARMHEIRSTVAGITSATHLLRRHQALAWDRRHELETMVESELGRLERLMGSRSRGDPRVFLLDSVLDPLVLAHRAQGHPVRWQHSGARAVGRSDDVVEVVNILLTNATLHGGGRGIHLFTRTTSAGTLQIVVEDSGPGVSAVLRRRLFEWGTRGPESGGQGIGLHIAQQLMTDQSGRIELEASSGSGATFVVHLPAGDPVARAQDPSWQGEAAP